MTDDKVEEIVHEASEGAVDSRRQIVKYVVFWVAIVALFLVGNIVIKSLAAPSTAELGQGGYYASGQPVAVTVGGSNSAGGGYGACGVNSPCGGSGSCCSSGTGQAASTTATNAKALDVYDQSGKVDFGKLKSVAVARYAEKSGDSNVTAEVKDFGCHQQITIKKGDKVVQELAFRGGQLEVLTQ